ncbi:MAG TPA: transcriptional regulator [Pseudonocardiaceae bacterium]|nr:transcriptional regulator [Pseudonocardiaceae bacterium]
MTRPDFRQACSSRDLGAIFAIAAQRGGPGFTRSHIARRCEMGVSRVIDYIEGRKQAQSIEVFERVCDGLGIPGAMLGVSRRSWEETGDSTKDSAAAGSQREWVRERALLNQNRAKLTQIAVDLYPESARLGRTGILMRPEWKLDHPIDLASVGIELTHSAEPAVTGRHEETRTVRPLASAGKHYDTYHRAMRDLDRPRLFENRICYRLQDAQFGHGRGHLSLGYMRYFDMIDVGEALAHELAITVLDKEGNPTGVPPDQLHGQLPFRRFTGDPFDLHAYPLLFSISTLTIRRSRACNTFVLLRRGMELVAIAGGMLSVMPTGVFQPASIMPTHDSPDFDIWRNMMREYSEEFLGNPEHDGDGDPIDYEHQEPFRSLNEARREGRIKVDFLGIGIDALNFVGDALTVAVFEADTFDEIFRDMVHVNEEGTVAKGRNNLESFVFDDATIEGLLTTEAIASSGAACLTLASRHREVLLGR